ncbi:MAG: LuxR family transcriptional regulator, partial [Paenibacillaceae bacterium]|nr:LuxR family transcriptional regulator [Paenibacillaceae bacterium]
YMDEAIDHAFASRDYLAAADYLSRHIADVLQRGEFPTLLRWFDCFPDAVDVTPELSLLHAFVLVVTGQAERAERQLARIERHYSGMEPGPERRQVQSGLLFVRSNLVFASGQFAQWFAFSEGILDELLPHSPIFYSFNYNKSEPLVRRTAFGLHGALSPETETIGKLFSGVLEKHGWGDSLINLYVLQSMAEGFYEWNRLEESQALLHRLERVPRLRHIPGLYVPARITQAYLYAATGRPELARDAVEEATAAALELPETHWAASLRACRLRLHLMLGELPAAKVAAEALHLSARDKPTFNREYEYIAFARFLGARHKEAEALRLLELLQPQALRENSLASRVEIAIAQACLQEQRGQRSLALVALHEALAIGEANGYVRSFVDAGNAVAKLLQLYAAQAQQPDAATVFAPEPATAAYVQRLLAAFPVMQQQGAAAPAPSSAPVEPLSRTELELLQLIREGESNRRIAARLHLSVGTVKVYVSRLYGKLGVSSRTQALARAQEWRLLREE